MEPEAQAVAPEYPVPPHCPYLATVLRSDNGAEEATKVLNVVLGLKASLVNGEAFIVTGAALVATFVVAGTLTTGAEVETAGLEVATLLAAVAGTATCVEIETAFEVEAGAEVETDAAVEVSGVVPLLAAFYTAGPGMV